MARGGHPKRKGLWMNVKISFNDGIISGEEARFISEIYPSNVISFKQRKHYDEYYYKTESTVELKIDDLEKIVEYFGSVRVYGDEVIIRSKS